MSIVVQQRPAQISLSGNPIYYKLFSSAAASDATLYFEIKVRYTPASGGATVTLLQFPFYPTNGLALVDIHALLDSKLTYDMPDAPNPAGLAINHSGNYYIEYREITPGTAAPSFTSDAANLRYVIKGGLQYFRHKGDNFFTGYIKSGAGGTLYQFLTWQQSGRLAKTDEKLYLYWLSEVDNTTNAFTIQGVLTYTDGTTATPVSIDVSTTANKGAVMYGPAGVGQFGFTLDPAKTVWYWQAQVFLQPAGSDAANPYTVPFRFYADNREDYENVVLHYRNSLGGLDSVRVLGKISEDLQYSTDYADTGSRPDYFTNTILPGLRAVSNNKELVQYKGTTGWLTKEEQNRLRDIFMHREVYRWMYERWVPVVVNVGTIQKKSTDDTRWTLPIEWTYATQGDEYYTPDGIDF